MTVTGINGCERNKVISELQYSTLIYHYFILNKQKTNIFNLSKQSIIPSFLDCDLQYLRKTSGFSNK